MKVIHLPHYQTKKHVILSGAKRNEGSPEKKHRLHDERGISHLHRAVAQGAYVTHDIGSWLEFIAISFLRYSNYSKF